MCLGQVRGHHTATGDVYDSDVAEETPDRVLLGPVVCRAGHDALGRTDAINEVALTTLDNPSQDAGSLGCELTAEGLVSFAPGDRDVPRDQANSSPHPLVGASDFQPMVAEHDHGVGGVELPLDYPTWQKEWRPARTKAKSEMSTHDFRHFFASALIAGGASVKQVQTVLGHQSAVVTLRTYAHLWPGDEDRTRSVIDGTLNGLRTICGLDEPENGSVAGQSG